MTEFRPIPREFLELVSRVLLTAWRSGSERHMDLVYGKLAATREILAKAEGAEAHDVKEHVTDRSTERSHLVFHDDTLRLDVSGPEWVKELVWRLFGEAHFDDPDHFGGAEMLSL